MPNRARRPGRGTWFGFAGRLTRRDYWLHYALPLGAIDLLVGVYDLFADDSFAVDIVATAVTLVASIAGTAKRLHDRNRSGWWQLLLFVPVLGWVWLLIDTSLRGTRGPNRFGPDPLDR